MGDSELRTNNEQQFARSCTVLFQSPMVSLAFCLYGLAVLLSCQVAFSETSNNEAADTSAFLTTESVVLITGAGGFIGSELALALHRTYGPKKLILIDSMDSGFGSVTPDSIIHGKVPERSERDLALLEFKRQRVFHVLQQIGRAAHFYRVDFRPNVPEFYEQGEVPVLHHIFSMHPDITHVVHLADHYHRGSTFEKRKQDQLLTQTIPRIHGQPKAGMMESLLEELRVVKKDGRMPHFLYASSYEVYNYYSDDNQSNPPPFTEDKPLSTPSSFAGASKLMDEVLAQTYFKTDSIYSVGLRLFSVYGPWGLPGSPMYEMAERVSVGKSPLDIETDILHDVRDFVYIDDAVDAIMSAMQFRYQQPVVFNVGSGKGTSLRQVGEIMQSYVTGKNATSLKPQTPETVAVANIGRAERVLGYKARVSLEQGLEQLLAWHYDRAYPYGSPDKKGTNRIADKGIVSCNKYDKECLKGTPVFPCASECAHDSQCIPTFYDDVLAYSRMLTEECEAVMYTISLEDDLSAIPSAQVQVSAKSKSHIEGNGGRCNIAFVSESSPLYRRLSSSSQTNGGKALPVMHGHWVLIPVAISTHVKDIMHILKLIPKLSPGQFFGSKTTRAIYCDPNVVMDNVPLILNEFEKKPDSVGGPAATAILIGKSRHSGQERLIDATTSLQERVQNTAYRMIRIAAIDEMAGSGFSLRVDPSFIVHSLKNDNSRLYRCDILGEVVQWDVASEAPAIEFVTGLHDMWSRVIAKKRGSQAWWTGDNLTEKERASAAKRKNGDSDKGEEYVAKEQRRRLQEVVGDKEDFLGHQQDGGVGGMSEAIQDAVRAVFGDSINKQLDQKDDDDSSPDEDGEEHAKDAVEVVSRANRQDGDADVWMGILSSAELQYYGHIVDARKVGVVHLDEYIDETKA